jgi:hypothetical protein
VWYIGRRHVSSRFLDDVAIVEPEGAIVVSSPDCPSFGLTPFATPFRAFDLTAR